MLNSWELFSGCRRKINQNKPSLFLLFVPVLSQALFPFVSGYFMSFSFLSAGHMLLFYII